MEKAEIIYNKYQDLIDYDVVNDNLQKLDNGEIAKVSKATILNIARWALNGASNKEIAKNLELTPKQFKTLCSVCPVLVYVMQNSREMADIILAGSIFQRAIGGQIIKKRVPVKIGDYEDGRKIGEHIEYADQFEELPPDSGLLRFLAKNKLSEKFGDQKVDEDTETKVIIDNLDDEQLAQLENELKEDE